MDTTGFGGIYGVSCSVTCVCDCNSCFCADGLAINSLRRLCSCFGFLSVYSMKNTQDIPADYNEISFVCLRPDGCLETPSTLSIVCRTLAKKLDGFEGFHFHQLRHPYVKHKTKSFLRNSRVFKADFCAPSHSLCTEVFHFPDNINLISGVNIHTFNQCVSQGGI